MSYDIYCYKSTSGIPDKDDVDGIVEADKNKWIKKDTNAATKLAIVQALVAYNPRLEAIDFHYGDISKLSVEILENETKKFHHIEICTKPEELVVRLFVYANHVFITMPYWYENERARQLFSDIKNYISIINNIAGYFVFDPQTGQAFDPKKFV